MKTKLVKNIISTDFNYVQMINLFLRAALAGAWKLVGVQIDNLLKYGGNVQ
jgi:hypothetical protein